MHRELARSLDRLSFEMSVPEELKILVIFFCI